MSARLPLFLCCNGPRSHLAYCRPLFAQAARSGLFDLVIGVGAGDEELVEDLAGPGVVVAASRLRTAEHGAVADLAHLAPEGWPRIRVWLGGSSEAPTCQWEDVRDAFERDLARLGLPTGFLEERVPMLDLSANGEPPRLDRPGIYLGNDRDGDPLCHFVFDLGRLAEALPDFDFWCTGGVDEPLENLRDASSLSWRERALLSESCEILVGSTMEPLHVTLTEANRFKPRAACGYDPRVRAPRWDYPGNPLELLPGMDDLVDFLLANARARCLA
ncbi:MAG: hypothetical protein Fur0037_13740 [Planctomycetota bacterium]